VSDSLEARVIAALSRLRNPRLDGDILSTGMVRDISVTPSGEVSFTFLLSRDDPATLVREARAAVSAVEGVRREEVRISVADPSGPGRPTHAPPGAVPAAVAPPPAPEQPNLGRVIAISSGKGGVGKSTVAANIAVALAEAGHAVGIMDADIYGPNIPRMFGVFDKPPVFGGRIQPLESYGVKLMSLGLLVERDAPAIWRRLDYFIVDLPPGTGDAQLSLVQSIHVSGALIVTTPQEVAVGDALRGARMFERVGVPVLGVVENMSGYTDPETGRRVEFFASGGGARLAAEIGAPLLGEVPLQPRLAALADEGRPVLVAEPGSPAAVTLRAVADALVKHAAGRTAELPILRG
jgi:ATP-binding protein involved in chromosome partitioning